MRGRVLIIEGEHSSAAELVDPLITAGFSVARIPARPDMMSALDVLSPDIAIIEATPADDIDFYQKVQSSVGVAVMAVCTGGSEKARPGGLLDTYRDFCLRRPFSEADLVGKVTEMLRQGGRYPSRSSATRTGRGKAGPAGGKKPGEGPDIIGRRRGST